MNELYPVINEYLELLTDKLECAAQDKDLATTLEIENLLINNVQQIDSYTSKVTKIKNLLTQEKFK